MLSSMIRLKVKKDYDIQIIELITHQAEAQQQQLLPTVEAQSVVEALLCRSPRDQVDLPSLSFLIFFVAFFVLF